MAHLSGADGAYLEFDANRGGAKKKPSFQKALARRGPLNRNIPFYAKGIECYGEVSSD